MWGGYDVTREPYPGTLCIGLGHDLQSDVDTDLQSDVDNLAHDFYNPMLTTYSAGQGFAPHSGSAAHMHTGGYAHTQIRICIMIPFEYAYAYTRPFTTVQEHTKKSPRNCYIVRG
jgi:hypothetical protein